MLQIERIIESELPPLSAAQFFTCIDHYYLIDETDWLAELARLAAPGEASERIADTARQLASAARAREQQAEGLDALLRQYHLQTPQGLALMELAEALLRIPDTASAEALIRDRLGPLHWQPGASAGGLGARLGELGLALGERLLAQPQDSRPATLQRLLRQAGEPWIRRALSLGMRRLGRRFVLGQQLGEALARRQPDYLYSFDMLGEASMTAADAEDYADAYAAAVDALAAAGAATQASVSIKLSALHPRYEPAQRSRVFDELYPRLLRLAMRARECGVQLSIDAEESDRLQLSLELFERLARSSELAGWDGLGLVVQAYSKRCLPVLVWLALLADELRVRFPLRLVKGAYWDSEIKLAQQRGLGGYPVFTRKEATDVAYLGCARFLLGPACAGRLLPQFASHNAQTLASVLEMAAEQGCADFEVQRLHGMGEALFDCLPEGLRRRIYAPVGAHRELLPYLVRRLLENGANASFVHRLGDPRVPLEQLIEHPLDQLRRHASLANPRLPPPARLFAPRRNSAGFNLHAGQAREVFLQELKEQLQCSWRATPLLAGEELEGPVQPLYGPWQRDRCLGGGVRASQSQARAAITHLAAAAPAWRQTPVGERAQVLERLAELLEEQRAELVALCCLEAGKTIQDGLDEVREAVDFCRYYAQQARELMQRRVLPGPVGELNEHYYEGRGLVVCISPWNFPLAIFLGQVCAALVTGNVVLAKPAEQTPLIAARAVQLLFEAGLPPAALALLPGDGALLGEVFCADPRVAAICFTGSSATARTINQRLAQREGALAALIAETGGQNALIADTTALPEQLVRDVIASAFTSAGQRCSALRVLCVPQHLAERVIALLRGAMAELRVGSPDRLDSDLGPLIDAAALQSLQDYLQQVQGRELSESPLAEGLDGFYLAPRLVEIDSLDQLGEEHFGPVLHLLRYRVDALDDLIDSLNALGYGLTLGVHSRNQSTIAHIEARARIGNLYVNRNQIGAVVGVQPFGGLGLSGTGPKAGGPDYLRRLCVERCSTRNSAAVGGNAALFDLREDD